MKRFLKQFVFHQILGACESHVATQGVFFSSYMIFIIFFFARILLDLLTIKIKY